MTLDESLAQLESSQLIRQLQEEELVYLFRHNLTHETAYRSVLMKMRRELHRLVAETYERLYPDRADELAAVLAEHFWQSGAWSQTVGYALRAGADSARTYASREALGHYERALAALDKLESPPPLQEYDALMGWAQAAQNLRPFAEQLERLSRAENIARDVNDKPRLARALYQIGGVHIGQGHFTRAIAPLAECFSLAGELDDERLIILPTYYMGWVTLNADPHEAIAYFDRAASLARRYDDTDSEALATGAKGMALARMGEYAAALGAIEHAQALLPRAKSPMTASDVDLFAGWSFLDLGDTQNGLEFGQRGVDKALAADNKDCVCSGYLCVGFNRLAVQQLSPAEDAFREAIRQSEYAGAVLFENLARAGLAIADFYGGRADAIGELERTHVRFQEMRDPMYTALVAQRLGAIYAQQGELARAEALLNEALATFRRGQLAPYLASTLDTLAGVYERQARADDATAARAEARQWQRALALAAHEAVGEG